MDWLGSASLMRASLCYAYGVLVLLLIVFKIVGASQVQVFTPLVKFDKLFSNL